MNNALKEYERKIDIIEECFGGDGFTVSGSSASYKEFSIIVGSFVKDMNSFSNAAYTAKERSAQNMCDKINRLCINETSKLRPLKTYGAYESDKESYIKEFERLAEVFKKTNQTKYY